MEGRYIISDGQERLGSLEVEKQGGYTLFRARCGLRPGILRLSLYGQGREGYLGVAAPRQGELWLEKKLSRAAMEGFPERIESVGPSGQLPGEEVPPEAAEDSPTTEDTGEEEEGPFWYARADGALLSRQQGRQLLALPKEEGGPAREGQGESRVIEGREYVVYINQMGD